MNKMYFGGIANTGSIIKSCPIDLNGKYSGDLIDVHDACDFTFGCFDSGR
jgi:hypothetical protein